MFRQRRQDELALRKTARVQKRIARYVEAFRNILADYETDRPNWRAESLLFLINYGLLSLRHYLESAGGDEVTWDSPFVELHYPLDWNWQSWKEGKTVGVSIFTGHFTEANTRSKKVALRTMAEMLVAHRNVTALQDFTNNIGFEQRGNRYTLILSADVAELLGTVAGKRNQRCLLELLYQPFSMGAASVNFECDNIKADASVPKTLARELAKASARIHLPPLEWTGNIDGHKLKILLVLQIHPFIIKPSERLAYFPITVGLHVAPDESDGSKLLKLMEEPWANPKNWSRTDQEAFWKQLSQGLEALSKSIAPTPPREVLEAVMSVNAKIKIVGNASDPTGTRSTHDKLMKALSKTGQIIHLECDTNPAVVAVQKLCWSKVSAEGFERLIFNIVSAARGYENPEWLTHTNAPDRGRDISVTRVTRDALSGDRRLRVVIQCKHTKCVGFAQVSQLRDQMALSEPPKIDELIIATSGRFSADAVQWVEKHNQSNHGLRITMWPNSHIERLIAERPHLIAEFRLGRK